MTARIDHAVTSGTFSLDGETFDVENNVWVVGDDDECVIIDAPHNVAAITKLVRARQVRAIICTHAHDDHVRVAPALAAAVRRADALASRRPSAVAADPRHPTGRRAGRRSGDRGGRDHPDRAAHARPRAGAVCLYAADLATVFTGDTLFNGGPGATGRSFSDRGLLVQSIIDQLLSLPGQTIVKTGHGDDTTIAAERAGVLAEPTIES